MHRVASIRAIFCAISLFAGGCDASNGPGNAAEASRPYLTGKRDSCEPIIFDDVPMTVCTADPTQHVIELAELDREGKPLRGFARLEPALGSRRDRLVFAMNAGMFDDRGLPIGLYVEQGRELQPLNQRGGTGNFYMKPNGVFYGDDSGWHIATASAFAARRTGGIHFATQSGPMLVKDGRYNAAFDENGPSRYIRNGVCVDGEGRAFFAISNAPVSFGKFARLFRDRLNCPNALYLDGTVSSLWETKAGRRDAGAPIGPIVVVMQKR